MFRFKVGDFRQYDNQGKFIGSREITEPTYYETLMVIDGFVECSNVVSREHLLNRGYIEIELDVSGRDDVLKEDNSVPPKNSILVHEETSFNSPLILNPLGDNEKEGTTLPDLIKIEEFEDKGSSKDVLKEKVAEYSSGTFKRRKV